MEAMLKKILDQVDDLMIAIKSEDDARIKSEYIKLARIRSKMRKIGKKPIVVSEKIYFNWEQFDKMMTYERSDKPTH